MHGGEWSGVADGGGSNVESGCEPEGGAGQEGGGMGVWGAARRNEVTFIFLQKPPNHTLISHSPLPTPHSPIPTQASVVITMLTITQHLLQTRQRQLRTYTIRVLLMVPIYAMEALAGLVLREWSEIFQVPPRLASRRIAAAPRPTPPRLAAPCMWYGSAIEHVLHHHYSTAASPPPTALHCICTALHCTALHCTALHCTALHCTALHCTALHCTALHCTARQVWRECYEAFTLFSFMQLMLSYMACDTSIGTKAGAIKVALDMKNNPQVLLFAACCMLHTPYYAPYSIHGDLCGLFPAHIPLSTTTTTNAITTTASHSDSACVADELMPQALADGPPLFAQHAHRCLSVLCHHAHRHLPQPMRMGARHLQH